MGTCAFAVVLLYRRITSIGRLSKWLWGGVLITVAWVISAGITHFHAAQAFDFPPGAFTPSTSFFTGLGAALLVTGVGLCLWLMGEWWSVDLGVLDVRVTMRYALWGFTTMVLGVQTIFGSFFLSMLGMSEKAREARAKAS